MTEHLGHEKRGVPQGPNVRNGGTPKTVQTDLGPVGIETPRDRREGTFEPQLVRKRQTRLAGLDEKVLGLYAGGMTVRDISAHLSELFGTEIGIGGVRVAPRDWIDRDGVVVVPGERVDEVLAEAEQKVATGKWLMS
jgi:hypothetical protein